MSLFARVLPPNLERRELGLTLFACLTVLVLALGTAVLMYPVVYYDDPNSPDHTLRTAFLGFCGLSVLSIAYLWESNAMIRRLRRQIEKDREDSHRARREACEELLKSMPKLDALQDRLAMEYRRTMSAGEQLSIVVVNLEFSMASSQPERNVILGEIAKAIARRLSEHDSMYLLGTTCLGVLLPGLKAPLAESFASAVTGGLTDVGGVGAPFAHRIDVINCPQHASSEHELYEAVRALIPPDRSKHDLAAALSY